MLFQSLNNGNPTLCNMQSIFLAPPRIHLNPNVLNQSIESFFELFNSSPCNRTNWNLNRICISFVSHALIIQNLNRTCISFVSRSFIKCEAMSNQNIEHALALPKIFLYITTMQMQCIISTYQKLLFLKYIFISFKHSPMILTFNTNNFFL